MLVYYGGLYVFPRILVLLDMGMSAAASLIVGACWEVPGIMLAPLASDFIARKKLILSCLVLIGISALGFAKGAAMQAAGVGFWSVVLMHVGYMGLKATLYILLVPTSVFGTELYPTSARNAGSAVFVAGGRIGAISAPLILEAILSSTGGFTGFFCVVAAACIVNALLFLPLKVDSYNSLPQEGDIIE